MSSFRFVFDLSDYSDYLDLNRFQFYHTAICGFVLAIATSKHLILTDGVSDGINQQEATIRVVLEFNEESIRATALTWITEEIICVGFESGYFVCFNCYGEEVFECKGHSSTVQSVRVCNTDVNGKGPGLWILYEQGRFISIPLSQVLKGRADPLVAFRLADRNDTNDFVFCPALYCASPFESDEVAIGGPSHSVLVGGMNAALSVYNIGGKAHFTLPPADDKQLTGYARDKVSSMISKSFMSLFSSVSAAVSSSPSVAAGDVSTTNSSGDCCARVEERCVTVTAAVDPLLDAKRRVLRLSIEPYGSLVAAADSLGRVTLYDTSTHGVCRVWKGLRDARLSWTHTVDDHAATDRDTVNIGVRGGAIGGAESTADPNGSAVTGEQLRLHLVVYAPQLGLVSVYAVSQPGTPCLRIVPVGLHGQLVTIMDETAAGLRVAKSFVMRRLGEGDSCAVEMVEIDPVQTAESDIDVQSAAMLSREGLGGSRETGETSGSNSAVDDAMLLLDDENDDEMRGDTGSTHGIAGGSRRPLGRKAGELRALQRVERVLRHLSEMHGTFVGHGALANRDVEASARVVDEDLVASAEQRVTETLQDHATEGNGQTFSIGGLQRLLRLVESLELTGRCGDYSDTSKTTSCKMQSSSAERNSSKSVSTTAYCQYRHKICFSVQFHRTLNVHLTAAVAAESADVSSELAEETRLRIKLLSAFEALRDIHSVELQRNGGAGASVLANSHQDSRGDSLERQFANHPSPIGASPAPSISPLPGAEDAASICRTNTSRGEALCWALRAINRAEKRSARQRMRRLQEEQEKVGVAGGAHSPNVLRVSRGGHVSPMIGGQITGDIADSGRSGAVNGHSQHTKLKVLRRDSSTPHNKAAGRTVSNSSSSVAGSNRSGDGAAVPQILVLSPHYGASDSDASARITRSLSFDWEAVSFSLFRAFHTYISDTNANAIDPDCIHVYAPVRLQSADVLRFVAAADSHFSAGAPPVTRSPSRPEGTVVGPPMRKATELSNSLLPGGGHLFSPASSSSSPSLTALNHRKQLPQTFDSTPARQSSTKDTTDASRFTLIREGVVSGCDTSGVDPGSSVWRPGGGDMHLAYSLLSFLAAPLQGDIFAMNAFGSAVRLMGAAGPEGLLRLPQLYLGYLAHQQVAVLVADVLVRRLSTSPFQRWLRESLLTLQDAVAAVGDEVHAELVRGACRRWKPRKGVRSSAQGNNLAADLAVEGSDDGAESGDEEDGDSEGPTMPSRGSSFGEDSEYQQLRAIAADILSGQRLVASATTPVQTSRDIGSGDAEDTEAPPISYDEYVRHSLRPAWLCARSCPNLEAVLAFAAVVLETLSAVHEQVERRTYGASGLLLSLAAWENLVRMARVALLLATRAAAVAHPGDPVLTIERLSDGTVSLHKLLAADTLSFAVRADQAAEHEERCQEVFNRRNALTTAGGETGDASGKSDVLLAWGRVADARWRDLIAVAVAEDALQDADGEEPLDASADDVSAQRRRAPMRRRRPLLLYFPRHSQSRFLGAYRGLLLADKWVAQAHRVDGLALVSEHLFGLPHYWRGAVAAHIYESRVLPLVRQFLRLEEDLSSTLQWQGSGRPEEEADETQTLARSQQLLEIMADISLLKTFVRAATEILKFVEVSLLQHAQHSQLNSEHAGGMPLPPGRFSGALRDETWESVWPSTTDAWLSGELERFYSGLGATHNASGAAVARNGAPDDERPSSLKWTVALVQTHVSLLWVLQLRFQCGLRGIKPSRVLGRGALACVLGQDSLDPRGGWSVPGGGGDLSANDQGEVRAEFVDQCLRRLIAVEPPVLVYRLAELWAIDADAVRLMHLGALLERDGTLDDEADLLVPQITNSAAVVDTVTAALRSRLGGVLVRIDRLATFGPLLASMDAEAVAWARRAFPADLVPDAATLEDLAKGRARAVNINLASTRHLVISMQGILLAVPVTERYDSGASSGEGGSWLERKGKCDALLSLCNSFSHLAASSKGSFK